MTGGTGTGDDAASASVGSEATGSGDAEEAGEQGDAAGTASALPPPADENPPWFDAPKLPDAFFEGIYEAPARAKSIRSCITDAKALGDIPAHRGVNWAECEERMTAAYVPGKYEVKQFRLDKTAWGLSCGKLPTGAFLYPVGWNDSRSGELKFPEGMSGSDFVKKENEADTAVVPVDNWYGKLRELLATYESGGEAGEFVRPPQVAWGSVTNPAAPAHRSRLAPGVRQPWKVVLARGSLEVVFHCKACGFRTIQRNPEKEAPLCHAAVKITIDGPEATCATIDILEACVHRASVFDQTFADDSGGRQDAPVPEPYNISLQGFLEKRIEAHVAYIEVNTSMRNKPASTFGALSFEVPVAEKLCGNTTRSGGVTSLSVQNVMAEMKRGGRGRTGVPNPILKQNALLQHACSTAAERVRRVDVMLPGRTCVVLFDDFRVLQFFREATWEGGGSALTMRGLVADFAQKFVHR